MDKIEQIAMELTKAVLIADAIWKVEPVNTTVRLEAVNQYEAILNELRKRPNLG